MYIYIYIICTLVIEANVVPHLAVSVIESVVKFKNLLENREYLQNVLEFEMLFHIHLKFMKQN